MSLVKKLAKIQSELKAPKSQFNKFGNYAYRNQEDILEAVKPLLGDLILTVTDEVNVLGEGEKARFYVTAIARITDGSDAIEVAAHAREPEDQKGMSSPQITGSASSYARKYALNGLFLIDDTKDADATNDHGKSKPKASPVKKTEKTEAKEDKPKSGNSFRKSVKKTEVKEDKPTKKKDRL